VRRLCLLALVLGLLAVPVSGAAAKVPFGFFGMNADGPVFDPSIDADAQFQKMASVGAEQAITEINWNIIQPDQGTPPDFSRIDRIVLAAARRHLAVMGDVLYAPYWACVDKSSGASPPDPTAYATFLRQLIARFGPQGSLWAEHPDVPRTPMREWQVWNEPPSPLYWSQQPFAKDYVHLLRVSRAAIKSADPGARVVLGGLTFRSWQDIAKIYRAGGRGLFDVVSLHPYTLYVSDVVKIIAAVRKVMDRHHDKRVPIYVTELGWPSAKHKARHPYGYEQTEKGEAAKIRQALPALARVRGRLGIRRVYWATWLSVDTGPYTFSYAGLNKVRNGKVVAKPALAAFRSTALRLEGCKRKRSTALRCR